MGREWCIFGSYLEVTSEHMFSFFVYLASLDSKRVLRVFIYEYISSHYHHQLTAVANSFYAKVNCVIYARAFLCYVAVEIQHSTTFCWSVLIQLLIP